MGQGLCAQLQRSRCPRSRRTSISVHVLPKRFARATTTRAFTFYAVFCVNNVVRRVGNILYSKRLYRHLLPRLHRSRASAALLYHCNALILRLRSISICACYGLCSRALVLRAAALLRYANDTTDAVESLRFIFLNVPLTSPILPKATYSQRRSARTARLLTCILPVK